MSNYKVLLRVNQNNIEYTKNQIQDLKIYLEQNQINNYDMISVEVDLPTKEADIVQQLNNCNNGCILIVHDLNVFGRTINNILDVINQLLLKNIRIIVLKQSLDLQNDDMLSQIVLKMIKMTLSLEKDLMSLRTKEALSVKKIAGVHLGKPKGTIQKSKFDEQKDKIIHYLSIGLSTRKIASVLGLSNHIGLNNYIKKRGLREQLVLQAS